MKSNSNCRHIKLWCDLDSGEVDEYDNIFDDPDWNKPDGWGNRGEKIKKIKEEHHAPK